MFMCKNIIWILLEFNHHKVQQNDMHILQGVFYIPTLLPAVAGSTPIAILIFPFHTITVLWHEVHSERYTHSSCFDVFCCGLVEVNFTHILQDYFTGTGAILWLPQCWWSNPVRYWWINHMNPQGNHSKTICIFYETYSTFQLLPPVDSLRFHTHCDIYVPHTYNSSLLTCIHYGDNLGMALMHLY